MIEKINEPPFIGAPNTIEQFKTELLLSGLKDLKGKQRMTTAQRKMGLAAICGIPKEDAVAAMLEYLEGSEGTIYIKSTLEYWYTYSQLKNSAALNAAKSRQEENNA